MRLQQQKKCWYKAKALAKAFEKKVYDQLAAKNQEAQTSPQKILVDACIDEIKKDFHCFHSSRQAKYLFSPGKSISVEEKFIISTSQQKTVSDRARHKSVEKPNKKNKISTLVLSQKARSAIVTIIKTKMMIETPIKKPTTRSGRIVRKKVHFKSKTNRR